MVALAFVDMNLPTSQHVEMMSALILITEGEVTMTCTPLSKEEAKELQDKYWSKDPVIDIEEFGKQQQRIGKMNGKRKGTIAYDVLHDTDLAT
jgi:hypothetical protein